MIESARCPYPFITGIKMNADPDHGCKERIVFLPVDHEPVQCIIIQYAVIDPFRCSALLVNLFIGIGPPGNFCEQTDIPFGFCFYNPAIFGTGTVYRAF